MTERNAESRANKFGRVLQPWEEESRADRIIGNLYLSDADTAADKDYLDELGINSIITIGHGLLSRHVRDPLSRMNYHYIALADRPEEPIHEHFDVVDAFIRENIAADRRVLVHCQAGVSRSATLVVAHLMKHYGMPFDLALKYVQARRPVVYPNSGFMERLREYDEVLRRGRAGRVPLYKLMANP